MLVPVSLLAAQAPSQTTPVQITSVQSTPGEKPGRQISLDVVVTGKDGVPVSGLTQQDFALKDNKANAPITQFHAAAAGEGPVEAILVMDAVNLNFINLANERSRIDRFLKGSEHLNVPTALAVFTDDGLQLQDGYSTNGKELSDVLDHYATGIRTTRRSSQHEEQDRFNLSIKALNELIARESTRPGRKLIFWVSPGWPLLTGPQIDLTGKEQDQIYRAIVALTNQMLRSRITLYSLNPLGVDEGVGRIFYYRNFLKGVTKASQAEIGDLALQVLATQSGGLALNSSNDLEKELTTCYADTNASYALSFNVGPGESTNIYHHLEVTVDKPGLSTRSHDGYYAQP